MSIVKTQLKEDRKEEAKVYCKLSRYQTELSSKKKWERDQDHINWNQSIATKKMTKQNNLNYVQD